jgi:hypothetical protein
VQYSQISNEGDVINNIIGSMDNTETSEQVEKPFIQVEAETSEQVEKPLTPVSTDTTQQQYKDISNKDISKDLQSIVQYSQISNEGDVINNIIGSMDNTEAPEQVETPLIQVETEAPEQVETPLTSVQTDTTQQQYKDISKDPQSIVQYSQISNEGDVINNIIGSMEEETNNNVNTSDGKISNNYSEYINNTYKKYNEVYNANNINYDIYSGNITNNLGFERITSIPTPENNVIQIDKSEIREYYREIKNNIDNSKNHIYNFNNIEKISSNIKEVEKGVEKLNYTVQNNTQMNKKDNDIDYHPNIDKEFYDKVENIIKNENTANAANNRANVEEIDEKNILLEQYTNLINNKIKESNQSDSISKEELDIMIKTLKYDILMDFDIKMDEKIKSLTRRMKTDFIEDLYKVL